MVSIDNHRMLIKPFASMAPDDAVFEAGWKSGSVITLEQAIELVQEWFPTDS